MERPIEKVLDGCLFLNMKKLDRMLNKLADEAFRRTGLAPTYGFILLILKKKNGVPQRDIAQTLYSAPSTVTHFVEKSERKGYVKTVSKGHLPSVYFIEQGRQSAKEIDSNWEEFRQSYKAVLGSEASKELAQTMSGVADRLQKK